MIPITKLIRAFKRFLSKVIHAPPQGKAVAPGTWTCLRTTKPDATATARDDASRLKTSGSSCAKTLDNKDPKLRDGPMASKHRWKQVQSFGLQLGVGSLDEYERRTAFGAAAAQVFLRQPTTDAFQLVTIRLVHRINFEPVYPWAGDFRTPGQLATIGGYVAADAGRIEAELDLLYQQSQDWRHEQTARSVADRAAMVAFFHARFERIHPFRDGNGRLGRLLLSEHLCRLCGRRSNIDWLAIRSCYLAGLAAADGGDLGPLANLFLASLNEPLIRRAYQSPFRIAPGMDTPE